MDNKIRILIVYDSILFRKILIHHLSKDETLEIVGYVNNIYDIEEKIPILKPNVIILNIEIPKSNTEVKEFLKQIIKKYPTPIIIISSLNISVFDALSVGVIDFVKKPDVTNYNNIKSFINEITKKILIASNSSIKPNNKIQYINKLSKHSITNKKIITKNINNNINTNIINNKTVKIVNNNYLNNKNETFLNSPKYNSVIIAIGASTGGIEATLKILKDLPQNIPGIVITQHMPQGFTKMYAERLDKICNISVKEAKNGDKIIRGQALIAPGDKQMRVIKTGNYYIVSCFDGEKVSGHKPSVDVLFDSVADTFKSNAIGIILTGMGSDGAKGICKMKKNGAYTIGQDKDSCIVYGMPMVAYNLGGLCIQASYEQIPNIIIKELKNIK